MEKNERIVPADSAGMYQVHGNHLDVLMDADRYIRDYLKTVVPESTRLKSKETEVWIDGMGRSETGVASVEYGDEDFGIKTIFAIARQDGSLTLINTFPYCYDKKVKVLIEKVWVWNTLVEATVDCSVKGWGFSFFATDYFLHREDYIPGREIEVRLGALGMRVKEGMHGFSFEGQQAADWLAKLGRKPDYDANGRVKPVKFSMEETVAFFNTDSKCPDEASFQSPAGEIRRRSLLGIDFYATDILIFCDGFELSIPLVFRREMLPDARKGLPLQGFLWVTGAI